MHPCVQTCDWGLEESICSIAKLQFCTGYISILGYKQHRKLRDSNPGKNPWVDSPSLIPLSVFFSFPVLFWCRFYPHFFLSAKGIWGLKKAQLCRKKHGWKILKQGMEPFLGQKRAQESAKKAEKLRFFRLTHAFLGTTLNAKGTLISEPRFSTPVRCDFSHARKGKRPFHRKTLDKGRFPLSRVGKNRISQGVENRGSLISVLFPEKRGI